jgi:hypothetical protein
MTRQPTIDVRIFFIVAFQTHPHPPLLVRQSVKVFNQAVTFPARNFAVDMPLMIEQNVLSYVIHLDPGGGGLRVKILMLLLDPGMFFDNIVMAMQTLFHRWNAGVI